MTRHIVFTTTLLAAACFSASSWAQAPVAGSTTVGITVTEATQVAMGWSVKKNLLGKTVYNDAGDKVGKVMDLIIDPERNVSYVIVGAGGFIGIGRHDVAVAVRQIKDTGGKLLMSGATKGTIQSMPAFNYASDTDRRDRFMAEAERDMTRARAKVVELKDRANSANDDAKAAMNRDIDQLQLDLKSAQDSIDNMKRAGTTRWHEFEANVSAATARLRKALEAA
jgi:sporulation protein YlmC with PRC-barrel domain